MPARNSLLDLQRSSHRITLYFSLNIKCLKPVRRPLQVEHQAELLAGPGRDLRHGNPAKRSRLGKGARKHGVDLGSAQFERTNGHRNRRIARYRSDLRGFALKAGVLQQLTGDEEGSATNSQRGKSN
jgi:hypothetical protein